MPPPISLVSGQSQAHQPSIHYPSLKITERGSAVNALPPELLSEIFLFCVALWPTPFTSPDGFTCGYRLPWIAITQVCQYWRSVALACGELWNKLLFTSRETTNEMIRRSAGVILVVKAEHPWSDNEHVRMVIPEMGRVSVLHLRFLPRYLEPLLRDIFSIATPRLEALRLSAGNPYTDSNFNHRVRFDMPDSIFARHSHTLRLLELTFCNVSWPSLLCLSSLTHLKLCHPATGPTMAQVLALLRGLPMLETLILDQSLPAHNDTDATSPRHFLPNLHTLTLGGRLESCSNVLKHITYPNTTIATFKCDTLRENLPFTHFIQMAHSAIKYERDNHIIHSLCYAETFRCFVLKFFVVCRSSTPLPDQKPQFNVSRSRHDDPQIPFTEFIHSSVAALSLVEVQALYLS